MMHIINSPLLQLPTQLIIKLYVVWILRVHQIKVYRCSKDLAQVSLTCLFSFVFHTDWIHKSLAESIFMKLLVSQAVIKNLTWSVTVYTCYTSWSPGSCSLLTASVHTPTLSSGTVTLKYMIKTIILVRRRTATTKQVKYKKTT